MLPLSLLKTAQGHPMLVELKNGETYNGHLVNCDTWMNIHLREVICTSKDGDRFWRMPECYIRGNTIKYLRVPDEVTSDLAPDWPLGHLKLPASFSFSSDPCGYSHAPDKLSYGVDMKHIRWCGILQRIALAYMLVSLLEIFTKNAKVDTQPPVHLSIFKLYCWQWLFGICILVIYLVAIYSTYVPDWEFTVHNTDSQDYGKAFTVICGARGRLDPPCNVVGYIDRVVLGINHLYQRPAWKRSKACTYDSPYGGPLRKDAPSWCQAPFEPEGILSSISAILSTIIGVHFGHVLVHMKNHLDRLKQWVVMGIALLVLGILLHFTHAIPLNKQLYSFSYVCVTAGAAAIVFSMFYFLVDVVGLRYVFLPLEWIGMNAMLVYVMAAAGIFEGFFNGWYYESPNNTLVYWIKKHIFIKVWHSRRVGVLLYVIFAEILFWALVAGVLQRLGIYWKL